MPNQRKREKRAVRAARHRAAFHADRARKAESPAQRLKAAEGRLLSAVHHSRRAHPQLTREAVDLAREAVVAAELGPASRELYEHKLASGGLGAALACLRAALDSHPEDTERDRLAAHYAAELTREAAEVEEGR